MIAHCPMARYFKICRQVCAWIVYFILLSGFFPFTLTYFINKISLWSWQVKIVLMLNKFAMYKASEKQAICILRSIHWGKKRKHYIKSFSFLQQFTLLTFIHCECLQPEKQSIYQVSSNTCWLICNNVFFVDWNALQFGHLKKHKLVNVNCFPIV